MNTAFQMCLNFYLNKLLEKCGQCVSEVHVSKKSMLEVCPLCTL